MLNSSSKAQHIRKVSGSTQLESTLKKVVHALAFYQIPHLVAGGYAVQEHGYPRFTSDIDIIVPNVAEAKEKLGISGFRENPGSAMTITDRNSKVEIDLLPGGGNVGPGPVNLPIPTLVSTEPQFLSLEDLISVKLSSYLGSHRMQDGADVQELIKANSLPRDFYVNIRVQSAFQKIWDSLHVKEAAEWLIGN